MKHRCPVCGKRVPKPYTEAHKKFHDKKTSVHWDVNLTEFKIGK